MLSAAKLSKSIGSTDILKNIDLALKAKETTETKTVEQTFSEQEYIRLEKIIKEYPILQERLKNYEEQIFYLKQLVESQTFQLHKIIGLMEQRNYIENREKNKEPL